MSVGSENSMGLERILPNVQKCGHLCNKQANFDCWKLEWTWCPDDACEVDDSHVPLASFSSSFLSA